MRFPKKKFAAPKMGPRMVQVCTNVAHLPRLCSKLPRVGMLFCAVDIVPPTALSHGAGGTQVLLAFVVSGFIQ